MQDIAITNILIIMGIMAIVIPRILALVTVTGIMAAIEELIPVMAGSMVMAVIGGGTETTGAQGLAVFAAASIDKSPEFLLLRNLHAQSGSLHPMKPVSTNIFAEIPGQLSEELFECILKQDNILIERIVSNGHITPSGQWYDQSENEWVILLQGQATLLFEKDRKLVSLAPGDYVFIPAHTLHKVEWTLPDFNTVWLAVHFRTNERSQASAETGPSQSFSPLAKKMLIKGTQENGSM